ncbi:hypothetical protein OOT46_20930 [Aquabacterium sp. A7-Y]|uniref:hypothetical protein n=1 Tax=Aquabacterium sp. A7-Y TaxID=1349605 RepID=UPI00223CDB40|nr:hypothetical protein [Aquabacterium sp. A7-Y]MCW7540303.1 hypothetical protein [Aquabacterium sp. A7-Y]
MTLLLGSPAAGIATGKEAAPGRRIGEPASLSAGNHKQSQAILQKAMRSNAGCGKESR